jgi:hypothetical protein
MVWIVPLAWLPHSVPSDPYIGTEKAKESL